MEKMTANEYAFNAGAEYCEQLVKNNTYNEDIRKFVKTDDLPNADIREMERLYGDFTDQMGAEYRLGFNKTLEIYHEIKNNH